MKIARRQTGQAGSPSQMITLNRPSVNQPESDCNWQVGPTRPTLPAGHMHVWCASQRSLRPHLPALQGWLAADETARASRFAFEHLRLSFAANRGLLRLLLSRYVDALPGQLQFEYSEHGKPALAFPRPELPLQFNLSHSEQLMLVAVTRTHSPGVDVEAVRPIPDMHRLAERFFAPPEAQRLKEAPPDQQDLTFFQYWVQKEAFIKAIGLGLTFPTNQFEVSILPGTAPRLVNVNGSADAALGWRLAELHPAEGYIGGLAIQSEQVQVNRWQVPIDNWVADTQPHAR